MSDPTPPPEKGVRWMVFRSKEDDDAGHGWSVVHDESGEKWHFCTKDEALAFSEGMAAILRVMGVLKGHHKVDTPRTCH